MKQFIAIACLLCVWACASKQNSEANEKMDSVSVESVSSADSIDYSSVGFDLMKEENFGGIRTGLIREEVIILLGEPEQQTEIKMSEVDGMNSQTWMYLAKGIEISFSEDENKKWTSVSYLLKESATQKSTRGIGVGSTREEVMKAYKKEISADFGEGQIIAGTVYGGIVFWLTEDGKVRNIFVGASAE